VVELNGAVAVAEAGRTEQALEIVDGLDLDGAQDLHEQPATFTEPELLGDYRTFTDLDRS
jgi:predicted RNA polymerase sigma factor